MQNFLKIVLTCSMLACSPSVGATVTNVIDGAWFDGAGNEVHLPHGAFHSVQIIASAKPVNALVALFEDACLSVAVGAQFVRAAIEKRSAWEFKYYDTDAGTRPGARLDGWQSSDVTVSSQPDAWPLAECNVYAARVSLDPADPVVAALTDRLGTPPSKKANSRRADGQKIKGTTFTWEASIGRGKPRRVYASIIETQDSYFLHLGLTE